MNLYLISQTERKGYDTYDSAVVAAQTPEEARLTHPREWEPLLWCEALKSWETPENISYFYVYPDRHWCYDRGDWASHTSHVEVKLIGVASPSIKEGVVCSSFNAG